MSNFEFCVCKQKAVLSVLADQSILHLEQREANSIEEPCQEESVSLCCLFCCPPWPPSIINKLACWPPRPPCYEMLTYGDPKNQDHRLRVSCVATEQVCSNNMHTTMAYLGQMRGFYAGPSQRRIACVFTRPLSVTVCPPKKSLLLLMSHQNALDLGTYAAVAAQFSQRLGVDVFTYDYAGYGCSAGKSSEDNIYYSIECAYDFLIKKLKVDWNRVIAVGQSLGTAATVHLASRRKLRGMILEAGFMSAMRVWWPNKRCTSFDRFVSIQKIKKIHIPTLILHGSEDDTCRVVHASALKNCCPGAAKIEPLIIQGGKHNDLSTYDAYWQRIERFLSHELQ